MENSGIQKRLKSLNSAKMAGFSEFGDLDNMAKNSFNTDLRPIGLIGNLSHSGQLLENFLRENDEKFIVSEDATIDEIKQFRIWLKKNHTFRKVAIIERLDKFSDQKQAVLLKIFENLPENTVVFFTASRLPNFTIQTRSEIYYVSNDLDSPEVLEIINNMRKLMENGGFDEDAHQSWLVFLQTESMYFDGIIGENEKKIILKSIGISFPELAEKFAEKPEVENNL